MRKSLLPQQGTIWRTERGCVAAWSPARTLLVVSLQGHGEAGFAAPILDAYGTLEQHGPLHLFFDAELLDNYDSPLRVELTGRFLLDRARFASFHVLLKSRIVAMGVSVANLALGGIVVTTVDRARFKAKLDECLYSLRVRGFSSNVLELVAQARPDATG